MYKKIGALSRSAHANMLRSQVAAPAADTAHLQLESLGGSGKVRWSVDVDPQESI